MENYKTRIADWPEDERPREKLIRFGPEKMSEAELLAILLRIGNQEGSAIDLARHLIQETGGLSGIDGKSVSELCKVKGIGPAKAAQIKAAFEIGKRLLSGQGRSSGKITCSQDIYRFLSPHLSRHQREVFKVIFLTGRNGVIKEETLFEGSLTESLVNPREVVKSALGESAAGVAFVHNHPSGDPTPSNEDRRVTEQLIQACRLVNVRVVDHVIIGDRGYYSFADEGEL